MTFARANLAYLQLRRRLGAYAGAEALSDITMEPPQEPPNELSFIRLVAWSYSAINETGKIALRFLKHLPPLSEYKGQLLPHVGPLRTWTSHNLALHSKSDTATLRAAFAWFSKTCGTGSPRAPEHWATCYSALCDDVATVLEKAALACDAFENPVDRPTLVAEFKARLEKSWDAYRFDEYVLRATVALGFEGIDVVQFRSTNLQAWRDVVANADSEAIDRCVTLRIESDLLALLGSAAPVTSDELKHLLGFADAEALREALVLLRAASKPERQAIVERMKTLRAENPA